MNRVTERLMTEVSAIPGGERINRCIQCGTCTGSCPNAYRMDYPPRRIIAMVRANKREQVLRSNSMWFCASCYLCTVRCPRDIKPTDLMHALELIAVRHGLSTKRTSTPAMHESFIQSVRSNGRIHEFGYLLRFYLKSNPLNALKSTTVGLKLFLHGRLFLQPRKIKGTKELKAIIDKARSLGGAH